MIDSRTQLTDHSPGRVPVTKAEVDISKRTPAGDSMISLQVDCQPNLPDDPSDKRTASSGLAPGSFRIEHPETTPRNSRNKANDSNSQDS